MTDYRLPINNRQLTIRGDSLCRGKSASTTEPLLLTIRGL